MSDSHFFHISKPAKIEPIASLDEALEINKTGGYIWLSYFHAGNKERSSLIEKIDINSLSVEDCLDEGHIQK